MFNYSDDSIDTTIAVSVDEVKDVNTGGLKLLSDESDDSAMVNLLIFLFKILLDILLSCLQFVHDLPI